MAATISLDPMINISLDLGSCISLLFVMLVFIILFCDRKMKLKMWAYWSLSLAGVFLSLSCLFGSGVELLEDHLPLIKPWVLYVFSVVNVLGAFILSVKPASKGHDLQSY